MPFDYKTNLLLYGIAKRVAMDMWSREQKNTTDVLRVINDRLRQLTETKDPYHSASEDNLLTERRAALEICMEKISKKDRFFLEEHYRNGVSIETIGKQNNISSGALRKTFCRLRAKLRDCIERTIEKRDVS